jgi:hypothetical protein
VNEDNTVKPLLEEEYCGLESKEKSKNMKLCSCSGRGGTQYRKIQKGT